MLERNAHCGACGQRFANLTWPRVCAGCGNTIWLNPVPVGVVLMPVDDGVLLVRRAIEPAAGQLALPGGFLVQGESWQEGSARELFEETGLRVDPSELTELMVRSPPRGHVVLIFSVCAPRRRAELAPFAPNDEVSDWLITERPVELGFPLHTLALERFFSAR